ncbi:Fc receptor-like protein 1 isoform X1 [Panthera leo]|uniref:Fc receptor-like protein 1 isoform X1 n=1 Tax=Panthera leo TaxID=9689 RepID=UPI001C69BF87|nr:Fc receptor-like protein 1 isoform X1 [Panthera leo]
MLLGLMLLMCAPPCELTALLLTATPSRPVEGGSVTLTCNVLVPSRRLDGPLQFCFFRDSRVLWPGWSSSPELQLPKVWREDSGSYWCEEKTMAARVARSPRVQIQVQRVPVCNVSLETQPPGGQVQKGERLALVCMVARGTGDITFLWYKGALGLNLETKTQRSLAAKYEIPAVGDSDTDKYYCAADNGYGPSLSELVSVTVRIPVSRPVLTIRGPGAPAEVGDVVELRCEAQRGSLPILYRFYHKNVTLGRSSAHAGRGASFNLSLTAEHSGNYSCEADNGLGARRSEAVPLNVTGQPSSTAVHALTSPSSAHGGQERTSRLGNPQGDAWRPWSRHSGLILLWAPEKTRKTSLREPTQEPSEPCATSIRLRQLTGPPAGTVYVRKRECCTRGRGLLFGVPHAAGTATSSTAPEDTRQGPGESESPSYFPSCSSLFLLPTAPQTLKLMAT